MKSKFIPHALRLLINKAMNGDPTLRYQSADEMRCALEHKPLLVDWSEAVASTVSTWTGVDEEGVQYTVIKSQQANRRWEVQTRQGRVAKGLRRNGKHCASDMRKQDADKRERRILQAYVTGRA